MGAIVDLETSLRTPLRPRMIVGRSPDCGVVLDRPSVSRHHAMLVWSGGGWELRDLASHNGTFLDGRRLPSGSRLAVAMDAILGFGAVARAFRMEDVTPPQPLALTTEGAWIEGRLGALELPGATEEGAVVWQGRDGAWVLEDAGTTRTVQDGELVSSGERSFRLALPGQLALPETAATLDVSPPPAPVILATGEFRPDEQAIVDGETRVALSPIESRLLQYLVERPGKTVSHRELLTTVWGYDAAVESRTVYVTANRLRRKVERDPSAPRHLLAVPGVGYRFVLSP